MEQLIAALIALVALAAMEIVLGIDNLVFIAILSGKLPEEQRPAARQIGLAVALITRLLLLFTLTWFMSADTPMHSAKAVGLTVIEPEDLSKHAHAPGGEAKPAAGPTSEAVSQEKQAVQHHPVYDLSGYSFIERVIWRIDQTSVKDLIILFGGLFLVGKSVLEIHHSMDPNHGAAVDPSAVASFGFVIGQIAAMDIVFSLDSVITAVGMTTPDQLWVMITAIILAVAVMVLFANPVSEFVDHHPSLKILALSFLILIGVMLTAEGTGQHIEKGYIYFAMAFALLVEFVNIRVRVVKDQLHPSEAEGSDILVPPANQDHSGR